MWLRGARGERCHLLFIIYHCYHTIHCITRCKTLQQDVKQWQHSDLRKWSRSLFIFNGNLWLRSECELARISSKFFELMPKMKKLLFISSARSKRLTYFVVKINNFSFLSSCPKPSSCSAYYSIFDFLWKCLCHKCNHLPTQLQKCKTCCLFVQGGALHCHQDKDLL